MSAIPTAVMVTSEEDDKANVEAKFPTLEAFNDAKAFCERQCAGWFAWGVLCGLV
jgi:hypothetical protein